MRGLQVHCAGALAATMNPSRLKTKAQAEDRPTTFSQMMPRGKTKQHKLSSSLSVMLLEPREGDWQNPLWPICFHYER